MAGSTLSLDSLSSPSPSPSPPPVGKKQLHAATKSIASKKDSAKGPVLDSDSELSELTDDDQDGAASTDRRERPATSVAPAVASSTSASAIPPAPVGVDADEHGNIASSSNTSRGSTSRRGNLHNRNPSTSRRGGAARKKRSSLVPAPMWEWAEAKANTSSAPVEEEEEEMVGPPRAMEEEEEEPNEPEEEEEDDNFHRDDSGIDEEEEGRFMNQRRLGPYVTQRLPGIRSMYSSNGRARRRQVPTSSRKYDAEDADAHINGDIPENGSASESEYNSPKKKRTKSRPPVSVGSRKRKGSVARESSASDHPVSSRKVKKVQQDDEEDVEVAPDFPVTRQRSGDESTKGDEDKAVPRISVSPSKFLPSSKPLSSIATSAINPAASALAALAVIADSVENVSETAIELNHAISTARKSPIHEPSLLAVNTSGVEAILDASRSRTPSPENSDKDDEPAEPQPAHRNKRVTRRAPARTKKASDDWRRLTKPVRSPNSKKPSLELKIDTSLNDTPDEPPVEAINDDTEEMEVDTYPTEADDGEKNNDLEVEEDEAEDVSEHEEDAQPIEDVGEGDDEPASPEGEGDGDDDQDQDAETNEVENEQEIDNENGNEEENEEEPLPDGDLEDQEIELQPAHRAEALNVLASIELKFATLRERVYVEKMEILAWEESMIQTCKFFYWFLARNLCTFASSAVHPEMQYLQKEMTKRRDKRLELSSRKRTYEVSNATKRRKADEDGVWSWWKVFDIFLSLYQVHSWHIITACGG